MRIVILQGSPDKHGSTSLLVEAFTKGALEKGHEVRRIDLADYDIAPCTGCIACGYEGPCVQADDNAAVKDAILSSDMLVFATPLYYYGMSAQLKTVVDRFCSYNASLQSKRLKSVLLSVAWNSDSWTFDALEAHYKTLVRYLNLCDRGSVLGRGCGTPSMTKGSRYVEEACKLGRSL